MLHFLPLYCLLTYYLYPKAADGDTLIKMRGKPFPVYQQLKEMLDKVGATGNEVFQGGVAEINEGGEANDSQSPKARNDDQDDDDDEEEEPVSAARSTAFVGGLQLVLVFVLTHLSQDSCT